MGNACTCCQSNKVDVDDEDSSLPLLHGLLKVHVIEAKDLPDTDNLFYNIARGDLTDPYVEITIGNTSLLKTAVIRNSLFPTWDEKFVVPVCHNAEHLVIWVRDREHIGGVTVGKFTISTEILATEDPVTGWYDVIVGDGGESQGSVHIWLQFTAVDHAKDGGKLMYDCYFQPQVNNRVTLYQDADTPQLEIFKHVTNADGSPYKPTRCWNDIFQSITQAKHFIYITGWSVFTGISLLRGDDLVNNEDSNVGEMLKRKAEEGVRVLVMTWNEKSNDTGLLEGMMGTHDEDTASFFAGTKVICANVPRDKDSWLGLGGAFVSTCYTHHQKTVICDAPTEHKRRRIIAFIGGLDITDGRYDTPDYPLYRTLDTCHAGDFYSNCTPGATSQYGPRQPWHDIHAKVEGPAAVDICTNFMERWRKQNAAQENYLVNIDLDYQLDMPGPQIEKEGGPWMVQLFRSITSDSAKFSETRESVLFKKYGNYIDNSIEKAYINIIRNAQSYIYIENQYFLGSAFSWLKLQDRKTLSHHIIPRELTQKIIYKIKRGQSFKVYVCIPMYPEGDPSSDASQEILYWQHCTMESMYKRIAKALEDMEITDKLPTDYLNFYCLGKRESPDEVPPSLDDPPDGSAPYKVRKSLRHPIYVHSKMLISDDDYVIVGSANINQRSLGGNRDTEICIGAYQPSHTIQSGKPRGSVYTFRRALWAAHLGGQIEGTEDPGSDECLENIRRITEDYWRLYTQDEPQHSDVHLLPYPHKVLGNGKVTSKDKPWNNFPDTSASVLGCKSGYLPAKLTT